MNTAAGKAACDPHFLTHSPSRVLCGRSRYPSNNPVFGECWDQILLHPSIKNSRIDGRSQHTHRQKSPAQDLFPGYAPESPKNTRKRRPQHGRDPSTFWHGCRKRDALVKKCTGSTQIDMEPLKDDIPYPDA